MLFIMLVVLFIAAFVFAFNLSNDLFGIRAAKNWTGATVFSCGIFCDVFIYYVSGISIATILGATALFTVLASSTSLEAKQLNADIRKFPTTDGLDHLVYRYQVRLVGVLISSLILVN